jgi:hemerythrin-like domain-containing protein
MTSENPIEVRDMGIVHRTLRTTFDESARLLRAANDPTPQRVAFLADHISLTLDLLHVHHHGEDLKLWPVLVERAPAEAEMVREVADQHAAVESTIGQVRTLLEVWREAPSASARDSLADSLENLTVVLSAHLDDEERLVVPLAAVTMTQDEWNAIGEHARASIPQEQIFLVFGMLLEPLDADDRAFMLAPLPPPVYDLWTTMGEPGWKQYSAQLRAA